VLFDLGPAVLDGVEVVGVGGQKDQTDVILEEHLSSVGALVGAEVIEDQNAASRELRDNELLQVADEVVARHGPLDGHRSLEPVETDEGSDGGVT
jgi:hypothetical protein